MKNGETQRMNFAFQPIKKKKKKKKKLTKLCNLILLFAIKVLVLKKIYIQKENNKALWYIR